MSHRAFRLVVSSAMLGIVLSGCVAASPSATPQPPTAAAPTAAATAVPSATSEPALATAVPVATKAVLGPAVLGPAALRLVTPTAYAAELSVQEMPAASDPSLPYWQIAPAHTEATLSGYPGHGNMAPRLYVYPISAYEPLSAEAAAVIEATRAVLVGGPAASDVITGVLPMVNAVPAVQAGLRSLDFQGGKGFRFITEYSQGPQPIANADLLYVYQGITDDGKYYVAAMLPVAAPFLPATADAPSPTPQGALSFPALGDDFPTQFKAYQRNVAAALNALPDTQYTPGLDTLDQLIQSIEVVEK